MYNIAICDDDREFIEFVKGIMRELNFANKNCGKSFQTAAADFLQTYILNPFIPIPKMNKHFHLSRSPDLHINSVSALPSQDCSQ